MHRERFFYWKLFWATFSLSAFTFGGGFVIIPLMRRKFVQQYQWIEEKEMLDLTAIAQSSPGSIAINASILVGYRLAKIPGAVATILGTVIPPFTVLSVISFFYIQFRDSAIVSAMMVGMQAAVVAVIFDVVLNMVGNIVREKRILSVLLMLLSFVAAYFFKVNVVVLILVCGVIGAADTLLRNRRRKA